MAILGAAGLADAQGTQPPEQVRLADGTYPALGQLARDTAECWARAGLTMEQLARAMDQVERKVQPDPKDAQAVLAYSDCMTTRGHILPR